ncbi:MAG: hypothetical protein RSC76_07110 [Oscillospiraceae bacterium]
MIDEIIKKALEHIASVVSDFNYGCEETNIVYQYNSRGELFGDDCPGAEVYSVLVHLNALPGVDLSAEKKEIKRSLFRAGFSYPTCINASDQDSQHYVFESEYAVELEDKDL